MRFTWVKNANDFGEVSRSTVRRKIACRLHGYTTRELTRKLNGLVRLMEKGETIRFPDMEFYMCDSPGHERKNDK